MANWLGGYANRLKLTLSDTNVDSDLTNFPVFINLGTSVGQGTDDVSCVFDSLGATACVWNSADKGNITLSNGDLTVTSTADYEMVRATLGKSSGKWYWETTIDVMTASYFVGVANSSADLNNQVGYDTNGWSYKANDGNKFTNNSGSAYGNTYTVGDVISVALDMDNGKVFFAKNGTWQNSGDPAAGTGFAFSSLSGTLYPADGPRTSADSSTTNFGGSKFAYTVPTGFSALDEGYANRKKIAVTTSDGTTQCYVEIEKWDDTNEQAHLWVKVPSLLASGGATLYLYYDPTADDNTTYVGDTTDAAAQTVWDSNFVGVWHMAQDPSGGANAIKDSTSNANTGTPGGSMTSGDLVDGVIGNAIDFDGVDDEIDCGNDSSLDVTGDYTLEAMVEGLADGANSVVAGRNNDGVNNGFMLRHEGSTNKLGIMHSAGTVNDILTSAAVTSGYHHLVGTFEDTVGSELWFDGASIVTDATETDGIPSFAQNFVIGAQDYTTVRGFYGEIDEVRLSNIVRSDAWIKATYYSNFDNLITFSAEEGWLSDWDKRIELSLANDDVDSTQTDIPVLIYLSTSSGISSADVSAVFDELTSDANRKKIAVTTSDGTTQCYVEIEKWDDANEKAWLWVKVPSLSSSATTTLFLYYDSAKSDNTTYVGDVNSTPGASVWDSNYVAVYHLEEDPDGDPSGGILDSTSNDNDATPGGSMTSADLVDSLIGKGIEFDGNGDVITAPISRLTTGTFEVIYKDTGTLGQYDSPFGNSSGGSTGDLTLYWNSGTTFYIWVYGVGAAASLADYVTGAWMHSAVSVAQPNYTHYNLVAGTTNTGSNANAAIGANSEIGRWAALAARTWPGIIDEVRVSNSVRTAAWLKACYHANIDDLITFGSEETYSITGTTETVELTEALECTLGFDTALHLTEKVVLAAPLAVTLELLASKVSFFATCPEPLSCTFSLVSGVSAALIGRDLWEFNSYITKILERDSAIEKITSKDSRITKLFDRDSSVR